jgi:hypothetical protein
LSFIKRWSQKFIPPPLGTSSWIGGVVVPITILTS